MTKLLLAALAALSISLPAMPAKTQASTIDYVYRYLPEDTINVLENVSSILYGDRFEYGKPVYDWLEGESIVTEGFKLLENTTDPTTLTESQLKDIANTLFVDYLYAENLSTYQDPNETPIDLTRGILDHFMPLTTGSEDTVYYYKLERTNESKINFFNSAKDTYNGVRSIVEDFIDSEKVDEVLNDIRNDYLEIIEVNRDKESKHIPFNNYCTKFENIMETCHYLCNIEDVQRSATDKKYMEDCYKSFIESDFTKSTPKELLGFTREELDGFYDLGTEEQEQFFNNYYPNYFNAVLYYYFETYSCKVTFEKNKALGDALNDITFPISYKMLDLMEAVYNDDKINALIVATEIIEDIDFFKKNTIPELTPNTTCKREQFIQMVQIDKYMLSGDYASIIHDAETAIEHARNAFDTEKGKPTSFGCSSDESTSILQTYIDRLDATIEDLEPVHEKTHLRSLSALTIKTNAKNLRDEIQEYLNGLENQRNQTIGLTIGLSVGGAVLVCGLGVLIVILAKRKKKEEEQEEK